MTENVFYDQITEQYYDFLASLRNLTVSEVVRKAILISNIKQLYKYIIINKPLSDDEIEYLSELKHPLREMAEVLTELSGIDKEAFDRLLSEGKNHKMFDC